MPLEGVPSTATGNIGNFEIDQNGKVGASSDCSEEVYFHFEIEALTGFEIGKSELLEVERHLSMELVPIPFTG